MHFEKTKIYKILGLPPASIRIVLTGLRKILPEQHAQKELLDGKIWMNAILSLTLLHETALNQLYL